MKEGVRIKMMEPKEVGAAVRYRLLTGNGTLSIRDFDTIDEVYDHIMWLVECGVVIDRLRVEQLCGTKYVREVEISKML